MAYDIIIMYFPISMLSKTYDLKRAPHVSKFSYTNSVMGYSRRMSCMVSTHGKAFKNVTKLKSSNKSFINFAFSKSRLQMMFCKCQLYSKDSSKSSILKSDTNNCVLFHLILKHLGQWAQCVIVICDYTQACKLGVAGSKKLSLSWIPIDKVKNKRDQYFVQQ